MKTNKLTVLLLIVLCGCANDKMNVEENKFDFTVSDGACFPEISDRYVYPVVPGMKEWIEATTYDDVLKFCQLPDNVLKSISTPGLIDALIHAPLFTGFYMLSNNASALKWRGHYDLFNSAGELFQRKDAGDAMVAYYKTVCFNCVDPPFRVHGDYERMMGLECLFTKQEILDKMGHEKKKQAVAALLGNYEKQPDNLNIIFPIAYIMFADKYAPIVKYSQEHAEEFQCILNGYFYSFEEQVDLILSLSKSFINDKK